MEEGIVGVVRGGGESCKGESGKRGREVVTPIGLL